MRGLPVIFQEMPLDFFAQLRHAVLVPVKLRHANFARRLTKDKSLAQTPDHNLARLRALGLVDQYGRDDVVFILPAIAENEVVVEMVARDLWHDFGGILFFDA